MLNFISVAKKHFHLELMAFLHVPPDDIIAQIDIGILEKVIVLPNMSMFL